MPRLRTFWTFFEEAPDGLGIELEMPPRERPRNTRPRQALPRRRGRPTRCRAGRRARRGSRRTRSLGRREVDPIRCLADLETATAGRGSLFERRPGMGAARRRAPPGTVADRSGLPRPRSVGRRHSACQGPDRAAPTGAPVRATNLLGPPLATPPTMASCGLVVRDAAVRAASPLALVRAGRIGIESQQRTRLCEYRSVLTIVIVVLVVAREQISSNLQRKLA